MPQLDFANTLTLAQVVWMAVIFGLLYYALSRYALPQVASVIENRETRISGDLDTARLAKAEADSAVAEVQAAGRQASTEAQAAIAGAVAKAKADAAEQARVANERLDATLTEAEARIGAARNAAMGALRDVATDTAATVVARLTGQPADPTAVSAAVGHAMSARA